jgi:hypothetical protein
MNSRQLGKQENRNKLLAAAVICIGKGIPVTYTNCLAEGLVMTYGTFYKHKPAVNEVLGLKREGDKFAEPDFSLKHKPLEDEDVPGSRAPEVIWTRGAKCRPTQPRMKIPCTRRGFVAIERSIAKWAKEKGQNFGGRKELQGVA